jgi:hypothetical protein
MRKERISSVGKGLQLCLQKGQRYGGTVGDHDGANPSHPIARRFQPDLR